LPAVFSDARTHTLLKRRRVASTTSTLNRCFEALDEDQSEIWVELCVYRAG
jgi:hypothetical protein